jgi:BCD family chlorophyll transporter-like MFS transporter
MTGAQPLGWGGIARLGLVQAALGGIVMLVTSLLNRVMVVEYGLAAALPAALVAWHYAVQLSRPRFGHGSDTGRRRTPWIVAGVGILALGALLATNAVLLSPAAPVLSLALGILAYGLIGGGVGAAGTSLLALLATRTAPERRPAAAAMTWMLMIAGIAVTAGIASQLIDPFSPQRLALVAGGIALGAFLLTLAAVAGVEGDAAPPPPEAAPQPAFMAALAETWRDGRARQFSLFVFTAMLAYSMQDMILEPFAGLVFGFTPGQSTGLASLQHVGVLAGMLLVALLGHRLAARLGGMRTWVVAGCIGSALALLLLAAAARAGPGFPLAPVVVLLGFCNGVFAVAAIGAMMSLAGQDRGREGIRMGLWGAAQAIAFGLGGLLGAVGVDLGRALLASDGEAFLLIFLVEAGLFVLAAAIAPRMAAGAAGRRYERLEGAMA